MSYRVLVRIRAQRDIDTAREWYERHSPVLGEHFVDEIDAVIRTITETPVIYQRVHKDIRRAMTRQFRYAIYFIVKGDRLSVLRVLHQARNPPEWME